MNPWTFTLALYKICPACKKRGQPPYGRLMWYPWNVNGGEEQTRDALLHTRQRELACGRCGQKYQARLSLNPQWNPSDPPVELLLRDLLHGVASARVSAGQLFRLELQGQLTTQEDPS